MVNVPIFLPEPDALREFLATMHPNAQTRGSRYFREGCVHDLAQVSERRFAGIVQGTQPYDVSLEFTRDAGWFGKCSCPVDYADCKHLFAFGKALLAEHSVAAVQDLSQRQPAADNYVRPPKSAAPQPLIDEVRGALGRELTRNEADFLTRVMQAYTRVQMNRQTVTHLDFKLMGLSLGEGPRLHYTPLKIWVESPRSAREFWNYVAREAVRRGVAIPEFMHGVTDIPGIEARLAAAQRAQLVERWKRALGQADARDPEVVAPVARTVDLRMRFGEEAATLEWLAPGKTEFAPLKPIQVEQLRKDLDDGVAILPPEAEWLWQAVKPFVGYGALAGFYYSNREAKELLGRLFRLKDLHGRLANLKGEPYDFATDPLRWEVEAPETEKGDYRIFVARPDGTPLPNVLTVFPGRPAHYITCEQVFRGPPMRDGVLDTLQPNLIPAAALETPGGVALLHALGVELPPKLRDRVRIVPLTFKLRCELRPSYAGSNSEVCSIRARADSEEDKSFLEWNGYSWIAEAGQVKEARGKRNGTITLHDRSRLYDPASIVAPLEAKWEGFGGEFTVRVTKKFPDAFAAWLKSLPPDVKLELPGELASLQSEAVVGSVRLDVTETDIDWFDLRVVLDVNDTTLTQEELKLLLNAKGGFVRLEKKGWRRLQFNLSEEEDGQLARLGLTPRELTAEPQRMHALQLADVAAKKFLPEPQFERIERRANEIKARVTPDVPANVSAELRPYQRDGFHFLAYLSANRFGGILADDMGLGKTLQTLAWLEWLRHNLPPASYREKPPEESKAVATNSSSARQDVGSTLASLVVCPKSVMDNWRAEAERFVPGLRVKIWAAAGLKEFKAQLGEADLHVMNYNQLRLLGEGLANVQWLAVILDEGQYIKNPSSVTAQIARQLRAQHRLVLSGTPIENRLMDLWSLMSFAMPGALGSRAQFTKLYDAKEDPFARRRLSARVRPFLLRRTKSQVAKDLPERIEEDLFCEIEGEQKLLYRAELKRAQQMLLRVQTQKQLAKERFNFLTSLLRLRQICCHPKLVKADARGGSAKLEALMEQLEPLMEEGHKVLVFSQFVQMLDLLRTEIKAREWPHFYLSGETENRGELVQRFQSAEGAAVFLISLKAGGFGLNLTAASYVVLFDPWWNPAVENQAIDRTHRIGQKRNVNAYRLLIKGSIEEKIRALQKTKSALADDVLGEEKFAQSLTLDDLQFLFSDE